MTYFDSAFPRGQGTTVWNALWRLSKPMHVPRSVVLVAPTPLSARAASFRPEIQVAGETTRVLVEQVGAVD